MIRNYQTVKFLGQTLVKIRETIFRKTQPDRRTKGNTMTERVKLGVIGTGHMGQYHVNVAKTLNDATLVGIYDSDLERANKSQKNIKL